MHVGEVRTPSLGTCVGTSHVGVFVRPLRWKTHRGETTTSVAFAGPPVMATTEPEIAAGKGTSEAGASDETVRGKAV